MCGNCGTYKDKEIVDVLAKTIKKQKKEKSANKVAEKKEETLDAKQLSK
jgi:hypothetical protein